MNIILVAVWFVILIQLLTDEDADATTVLMWVLVLFLGIALFA